TACAGGDGWACMGNGTGALASKLGRGDGPPGSSINRSAMNEPFGCEISEQQGRAELRPVTYRAKPKWIAITEEDQGVLVSELPARLSLRTRAIGPRRAFL